MSTLNAPIKPWKSEHIPGKQVGHFITPPEIIYRYLPSKRIDSTIQRAELYFSTPDKFDDPYDMHPDLLDFSYTRAEFRAIIDKIFPFLSKKERQLKYDWFYTRREQNEAILREYYENARKSYGVCCFSESPLVKLMWSHYAESYQGICLGFNIEPFPDHESSVLVQPVKYVDEIVPMKVNNLMSGNPDAIGHWLLTKLKEDWGYQKEIRAAFRKQNGRISFDKKCLKEIYFGYSINDVTISRTIELLISNDYHGVRCFKIVLETSIFNIKAIELEVVV